MFGKLPAAAGEMDWGERRASGGPVRRLLSSQGRWGRCFLSLMEQDPGWHLPLCPVPFHHTTLPSSLEASDEVPTALAAVIGGLQ